MTLHAGENPLAGADTPLVTNLTLTLADTEYNTTLANRTRKFSVRLRDNTETAKMSFTQGESGTKYWTIDRLLPFE